MEKITKLLEETGFYHVDVQDVEALLSSDKDRQELLLWCLKEIDEHFSRISRVDDDTLKDELQSLLEKLGFSYSNTRDKILGKLHNKHQIQFWLNILNIIKCIQQRNKFSEEQQSKSFMNTSNMWHKLLQGNKYKKSVNLKMKLIPIELKSAVQLNSTSLTSVVENKDILQQKLLTLKEENQDTFDGSHMVIGDNEVLLADLKSNGEKLRDLLSAGNITYEENSAIRSSQTEHSQVRCSVEMQTIETTISSVHGELNTFNKIACCLKMLVSGNKSAVLPRFKISNYADDENLCNEIFECIKLFEK